MGSATLQKRLHLRQQLVRLVQLDKDTVSLYEHVLDHVADEKSRALLRGFLADHLRHVSELPVAIERIGWTSTEVQVDLKGLVDDCVASVRCLTGYVGTVHVLHRAEANCYATYARSLAWDVGDPELEAMLRGFHKQEQRHLALIENWLFGKAATSGRRASRRGG